MEYSLPQSHDIWFGKDLLPIYRSSQVIVMTKEQLFSFPTLNITTDAEFEEYIGTYMVSNASTAELAQLMTYYPSDPALGSPFDTGDNNALTPQFKRIAAFLGDFVFQAPRRFFTQSLSRKQNVWTYLYKRGKLTPYTGASHASDLLNAYTGGDILPYLLRFVTHLDPNTGESTDLYWPQYDAIQTGRDVGIPGWFGPAGFDHRYISCKGDGVYDECVVDPSVVASKRKRK
ncbi:hypothetical protein JVU11DRAFT_11459 [Chiua virens]|nr:hypothetical protein JVU11DRAFT_11459 [Chiua virens]